MVSISIIVKWLWQGRTTQLILCLFFFFQVWNLLNSRVKYIIMLHPLRGNRRTSRSLSGGGEGLFFRPLPRDFDPEPLHVLSSRSLIGVEGLCTASNSPRSKENCVNTSTSVSWVWVFCNAHLHKFLHSRSYLMIKQSFITPNTWNSDSNILYVKLNPS